MSAASSAPSRGGSAKLKTPCTYGSIWSAHAIRAGTVWINMYHTLDIGSPFGGYKQSGYGRELGKHALDLYTQVKSVWVTLG